MILADEDVGGGSESLETARTPPPPPDPWRVAGMNDDP